MGSAQAKGTQPITAAQRKGLFDPAEIPRRDDYLVRFPGDALCEYSAPVIEQIEMNVTGGAGSVELSPEVEDRCLGALLGLAVGDALGAPLEFSRLDYGRKILHTMGQEDVWKILVVSEGGKGSGSGDSTDGAIESKDSGSGSRCEILAENVTFVNTSANKYNRAFQLLPGQWTDDTSMALCLADSLLESAMKQEQLQDGVLDEEKCGHDEQLQGEESDVGVQHTGQEMKMDLDGIDLRMRFLNWWHFGYNNAFGRDKARIKRCGGGPRQSVGLGGNIGASLREFYASPLPPPRAGASGSSAQDRSLPDETKVGRKELSPVTLSGDRWTSGNGSLMRLAPAAIRKWNDLEGAQQLAELQSLATHRGVEAAECSRLLAHLIVGAIAEQGSGTTDEASSSADNKKRNMVEERKKWLLTDWISQFESEVYSVTCLANAEKETKLTVDGMAPADEGDYVVYAESEIPVLQNLPGTTESEGQSCCAASNPAVMLAHGTTVLVVDVCPVEIAGTKDPEKKTKKKHHEVPSMRYFGRIKKPVEGYVEFFDAEKQLQGEQNACPFLVPQRVFSDEKDWLSKNRDWQWRTTGGEFKYSAERARRHPDYIGSYCMDCLAMALHCVWATNSFADAVLKAANLGGDADTVCAVIGQITGALYGAKSVPGDWREKVESWTLQTNGFALRAKALARLAAREKSSIFS
ncbi:unnamed protein product [Amoebophrya sp. A25]|nr:unnamed protein product [Amoebophrya sp. A25]|eukprot:GSA25T00016541001.1